MDERILIVEDEEITSMLIMSILENKGYSIYGSVPTGEEAVELAQRERPLVVIMDINLAGEMTGIDAVKEMNLTGRVPVIYVTANSDDATRNEAMKTGPAGYLNKPIDFQELFFLIEGIKEKNKNDESLLRPAALYKHIETQ